MELSVTLFYFFLLIRFSRSANLPEYLHTCKRNDPNINNCFLKHANSILPSIINGDQKIGLIKIDPLAISEINIDHGSKQAVGLKLKLKNIKMRGLRNSKFTGARIDIPNNKWQLDLEIPEVNILADYKAGGRFLVLPITGEGKANITARELIGTVNLNYKIVNYKGKKHIEVMENNENMFAVKPKKISLKLENLFNGDKTLGENFEKFLEENENEIINEIGVPVINSFGQVFLAVVNPLAKLFTYDQLLPE